MNGRFEECLQKIEEFLDIDDKIITYKWLSKALQVHTNTAKQLLYAYTTNDSNQGKHLVTYIVAGERPDCEGLDFRLVTEADLDEVKLKFSKISSVHVYSVQKGTILSGSEIYNAETSYKLTEEEQRFSSIIPGEEIARREIKGVPCANVQNAQASSKFLGKTGASAQPSAISDRASSSKHGEQSNKEEEKPEPKKQSPKKKAPPPPAKNRIGALFKKQSAKISETLPKKESIETPVADPTPKSQTLENKRKKSEAAEDDSSGKQRKRIRVASESDESNDADASKSLGKVDTSVRPSTVSDKAGSSEHEEQSNVEEEKPAPRRTSPRKKQLPTTEENSQPTRTSPRKKQSPKKGEKPEKKTSPPPVKKALFKKQSAKNQKPSKKETTETAVSDPTSKSQTPKNKRNKSKAKEELSSKQRKRIRVASESEESDEESDADERFPSPEPEAEAAAVLESEEEEIIPSTPQECGRKRVRKLVDRTYVGEDGYILTKKEFVTESCSDDEVSEPASKKLFEKTPQKSETVEDEGEKPSPETSTPNGQADAVPKGKGDSSNKGKTELNVKKPAKKGGRPAKAKAADPSPTKQSSILSFFRKK